MNTGNHEAHEGHEGGKNSNFEMSYFVLPSTLLSTCFAIFVVKYCFYFGCALHSAASFLQRLELLERLERFDRLVSKNLCFIRI
jgi:hypothetical protein